MKRSVEILKAKNALKNDIETLQKEGKTAEAHAKLSELEVLNQELDIAITMEQEAVEKIVEVGTEITTVEDVDPNVIFNKQLTQKELTASERAYVQNAPGSPGQIEHEDERGGYLVPEQNLSTIHEFRRKRISLKDYVNVVEVTTLSGKFPVETKQNGKLTDFEELTEIQQSQITFAQQSWKVKDKGDIIPVSNTLLEDTNVNLMKYIGSQFTKKAVNTENADILALLKKSTKQAGTTHDDIRTVLNTKLDPDIAMNAKIITNQSGFDYLDKIKDKNGRGILEKDLTDETKKAYKGKTIIVLPDELLANAGTTAAPKIPFFVGDFEEAINFYDRKGLEVAVSTHAGFTKNATLLRAIERYDVQTVDKEAVVFLEITPKDEPAA